MRACAWVMLRHLGLTEEAQRLRDAVVDVVNVDGIRTSDVGGSHKTSDFMTALEKRLVV
ncbi:unnamed protein product [Oikopleura dioica]|uniref:Uncharacterized protein n=1 Tax=Oikopleura dioica TaxID=34765 RepID=E4XF31_OIKDI|nr:unnamed protein product [Oikopleura dioica]